MTICLTKGDRMSQKMRKIVRKISGELKRTKGIRYGSVSELSDEYGVRSHIDTTLPSLNVLMCSGDGNEGYDYGVPCGRVTEFAGESESYKTWLIQQISASTMKAGGPVWGFHSEFDLDPKFCHSFWRDAALDIEAGEDLHNMILVTSMDDLKESMQNVFSKIMRVREADKSVPILIYVDSLGALMSAANRERYEAGKDEDLMAAKAKDIHRFFQYFMGDIAKYGVAFVYANHMRANMGGYGRSNKPANDGPLEHYATHRYLLWTKNGDKGSSLGREFTRSRYVTVCENKKRGPKVGNGMTDLMYHHGYGFDYVHSLVEAMMMTGLLYDYKGYRLGTDPGGKVDECKWWPEVKEFFLSFGDEEEVRGLKCVRGVSAKKFNEALSENLEILPKIEKCCYASGPRFDDDKRMGGPVEGREW